MKRFTSTLFLSFVMIISSCSKAEHVHTFSSDWTFDNDNHWHAATCEHKDLKDSVSAHTFGDWHIDEEATAEHDGSKHRDCTVCAYSQVEPIPYEHVHTFSSEWSHDDDYHWHAATCGHNVVDSHELHIYGSWVIDRDATKELDGLKHRTCSVCEYVQNKTFPYEDIKYKELQRIFLPYSTIDVLTSYTSYINPVAIPYPCDVNFKYDISNPSLITIKDGVITGKSAGNAIVKVYDDKNDNNVLDSNEIFTVVAVNVKESDPKVSLTFEKDVYSLEIGKSENVKFTLEGGKSSGFDYGYYSDDEDICTFASSKVVAHKAGTTNISISWQGYRATAKVIVSNIVDGVSRVSEISTEKDHVVIEKGDTFDLGISLLPLGNSDSITIVSSNNNSVASCSNGGVISAHKSGNAILDIKTTNPNVSKKVYVVVTDSSEHYDQSYYNNYYGDLTWENGEDLKQKLHDIISKNVTPLRYDQPNWETNQFADQDLYDYSMVDPVYSSDTILKTNTNSGWQREHSFAASLMTGFSTGAAVTSLGRSTDFHNLFAADSGANGSRGNKNFGYANSNAADYQEKSECGYVRKAFEPSDTDKGRLARAIFYMGVMYNTTENASVKEKWTYKGPDIESHSGKSKTLTIASKEQPLEIVEDYIDYNKVSLDRFMYPESDSDILLVNYYRDVALELDPSLEPGSEEHRQKAYELYTNASMPYAIGNFSTLLKWNAYSVDYIEMQHNESVYSHNSSQGKGTQGNRNPFVDYPQLVDYVYGDLSDKAGSLKGLRPTYISLEMDQNEVHHYAYDSSKEVSFDVGDTFNASKYDFKAIKNDLSEVTTDYSKFSYDKYVFTESDAGKVKQFAITTDKNSFTVSAKVKGGGGGQGADSLEECTYYYRPESGSKTDYAGSGTSYVATLGDQVFDVTFETEAGLTNRNSDPCGVKIGTENAHATKITYVSRTSFTGVDAVYFYAITASGTSYSYTIKVGSDVVDSGSLVAGSTATYYGKSLSAKYNGVVTVEITNVMKGLTFCGIGINY